MAKMLPKQIDPLHLCDRGARLEGEVALAGLKRVAEVTHEKTGVIKISLEFARDKQGFRTICGKIAGHLQLVCQRCMQPLTYPLDIAVKLSPVMTEAQAKNLQGLPKDFDALIVDSESMLLADMIEEEIILNLPIIANHEAGKCPVELPDYLHIKN